MTRVSICIPTYNGERFVSEAIASVLGQTYTDFELLVCDDCSTDSTLNIVSSFADTRLRVIAGRQRLGLVGNWNRCVEIASGEYIQIFHQDDVMEADCVQQLTDMLDQNPRAGFAFTNMKTLDAEGKVIGGHWSPAILPRENTAFTTEEFLRLQLGNGNLVPCPSVMVRSRCYSEVGLFDDRLRYTPDVEMWFRLALRHDIAYIATPLVHQRRHMMQESSRFIGKVGEVDEMWNVLQILFREQYPLIPEPGLLYKLALDHFVRWSFMFCRSNVRQGHFWAARAHASRWLKFHRARARGLPSPEAEREASP